MIIMQGKYRLTFPVSPAEVSLKGLGNDIETTTTILLTSNNRISSYRPEVVSFDFVLPFEADDERNEVDGYKGALAWIEGLKRIKNNPLLLTIEELSFAMNMLVGNVEGKFVDTKGDYRGSIEFHSYKEEQFVTWVASTSLLSSTTLVQQQKKRPNTSGKTAKKPNTLIDKSIQLAQKQKVEQSLADFRARRLM